MRCWTSLRPGASWTKHPVVVHPDWSISTPHDLVSERVAAALGGYLSCLELQDRTLPAARRWLELQRREGAHPVELVSPPARWRARQPAACCPPNGFDTAAKAADHVRDARHLVAEFGCPRRQFNDLVKSISAAYTEVGGFGVDPAIAAEAEDVCTWGAADVISLWHSGVHPRRVVQIHESLGVTGRLPARFFLGVVSRRTDIAWLARTLRGSGVDPCARGAGA